MFCRQEAAGKRTFGAVARTAAFWLARRVRIARILLKKSLSPEGRGSTYRPLATTPAKATPRGAECVTEMRQFKPHEQHADFFNRIGALPPLACELGATYLSICLERSIATMVVSKVGEAGRWRSGSSPRAARPCLFRRRLEVGVLDLIDAQGFEGQGAWGL